MEDISCDFVKTDITLVKFFQDIIFLGNGYYLYIYDRKSKSLKKRIYVFDEHIFGLSIDEKHSKILLHGGKFIKLYQTDLLTLDFKELAFMTDNDWILAAKFINNGKYIATISMHNVATLRDSSLEIVESKECIERCISYCAHIINENWNDLIILSGTVFSQVLLWWPMKSSDELCPVICRLIGHKGVIFSIDYHQELNTICTTSDDRTAIIWDIKNGDLFKELIQKPNFVTMQPKYVLMGHTARVFKCKILNKFIITAGEDGLVNIWHSNGELFRKIDVHQNRPVWTLDYHEDAEEIVTGGGDSGLFLFKLHSTAVRTQLPTYKCENPKKILLLSHNSLVYLSENGVLILHNTKDNIFTQVFMHDDLKSYGLLEKSPCGSCIALAGYQGNFHIYKNTETGLIYTFSCQITTKQRIFSLHWLSCRSLLTCEPNGVLTVWIIKKEEIVPIHFWELPHSRERWTTAACSCGSKHVLVGDRRGAIYLYSFESSQPLHTIKRAHNYLGITNLYFQAASTIISLGRNSTLNEYQVDTDRGRLVRISSHKVPFIWLANLYGWESKDFTLLLGFSGANLVIYDYTSRRILFETDCGGGHRSWDFNTEKNQLTFAYVKDKHINLIECNLTDIRGTNAVQGYHSSEINMLKLLKVDNIFSVETCRRNLCCFISGGEDTVLRISSKDLSDDLSDFKNINMLKSHLSSIRTIATVKINEEKYYIFSGGGRSQILLWELSFSNIDGEIFSTCSEKCNNYEKNDLSETRVMAMSTVTIENDVLLLAGYSDGHVKVFRVHSEVNQGIKLVQVKEISPHIARCILQISILSIDDVSILITMATDGAVVFTNVSDIFSSLESESDRIISFKLHQSGINSFDYYRQSILKFVFLTGGDDSAISLNAFDIKHDEKLLINRGESFVDESYHGAQVTGVKILEKYFLTASVDQKVLLYKWDLIRDGFVVQCLQEYHSGICDIKGMECELLKSDSLKVFVYGRGCEILTVKLRNK